MTPSDFPLGPADVGRALHAAFGVLFFVGSLALLAGALVQLYVDPPRGPRR